MSPKAAKESSFSLQGEGAPKGRMRGTINLPRNVKSPSPDAAHHPLPAGRGKLQQPATVNIILESKRWPATAPVIIRKAIRETLSYCLPKQARKLNVDVTLTHNKAIQKLNRQWRGFDKPTDVLSFPTDALGDLKMYPPTAMIPLGDIVIAYDYCAAAAVAQHKSLRAHIMHLAVHGTLHLLGYDHETDADLAKMTRTEVKILAKLGIANPYASMTK